MSKKNQVRKRRQNRNRNTPPIPPTHSQEDIQCETEEGMGVLWIQHQQIRYWLGCIENSEIEEMEQDIYTGLDNSATKWRKTLIPTMSRVIKDGPMRGYDILSYDEIFDKLLTLTDDAFRKLFRLYYTQASDTFESNDLQFSRGDAGGVRVRVRE